MRYVFTLQWIKLGGEVYEIMTTNDISKSNDANASNMKRKEMHRYEKSHEDLIEWWLAWTDDSHSVIL